MPAITTRPAASPVTDGAFADHQEQLLAHLASGLPETDWHTVEDLAQDVWLEAHTHPAASADDVVDGLPGWLHLAARRVVRRHLGRHPASEAHWGRLTQILGHSDVWPVHWHRLLEDDGEAALLRQACADFAAPLTPRGPGRPVRVLPLPLGSALAA